MANKSTICQIISEYIAEHGVIECIDMWERSNNAKEYEGLYDKAMAHNRGE